jgi:hypothetical protein
MRVLSSALLLVALTGCAGQLRETSPALPSPGTHVRGIAGQDLVVSLPSLRQRKTEAPDTALVRGTLRLAKPTVNVYVSAFGNFSSNAIPEYLVPNRRNLAPECHVFQVFYPNGIGVNAQHFLYVPEAFGQVLEFNPKCGAVAATVTLPAGRDNQGTDVAFDTTAKIAYVDTVEDGVYPIPFGSTTPGSPLTCNAYALSFAVATDSKGDVFAAGQTSTGTLVVEWAGGKGNCQTLGISGFGTINGLTMDSKDNLIDIDDSAGILVWAPPYNGAPNRVIKEMGASAYGKLDAGNRILYVADYENLTADAYDYKTGTYNYSWNQGLPQTGAIEGIAVDP